jgi:DNA-binding response OmpR family regulator
MSSRRALIIDDEPDVATYLATLLSDHGWNVRTAHDVNKGLELAREEIPDVVLLDLMMPDRGGLSALVELRIRNFLARFKYRKADAFLDKPVEPDKLLKTVDELTSRRTD